MDIEQVEIKITWCDKKPIEYWFNDKLVWSADEGVKPENVGSIYATVFELDLIEAVRFSVIFINGLTATSLIDTLTKSNKQLSELNRLKDDLLLEADFDCSDCEVCDEKYTCPAYQGAKIDEDENDAEEWDDEDDL